MVAHARLEEDGEPAPFPKGRAYLIGLVLLVNNVGMMMLIPFTPQLTAHFFPALDVEALGYEAGYLNSVFFAGSFVGSLFWGYMSDLIGRRPCLLLGILGTIVSIVAFGFSLSFGMALTARAMWGALNGNVGVAKTYMSEICDDSNQARGMSLIAAQGGLGRLIGPAIGGLLAEPATQYPSVFGGSPLLVSYPYLLPCLICAMIALTALIFCCIYLRETLPSRRERDGRRCGQSNAAAIAVNVAAGADSASVSGDLGFSV